MPAASKECRDCGEDKPLVDFPPAKERSGGRGSYCRPCMRVRHRVFRDARRGGPPTRVFDAVSPGDRTHEWCPRCQLRPPLAAFGSNRASADGLTSYCRACHNVVSRQACARLHGSTRDFHLKRRSGLTSADVDAMVEAQGGVCAVCRERTPRHVDHDHLTGEVRGVLCSGCNQGLGNVKDDAARLRLAADYVEQHSWQHVRVEAGVYRLEAPRSRASAT